MKAMIFAAGIGSRLKPFTDRHPKALAPVAGVPALQRVIEHLHKDGGVNEFVVNIHHFSDQIKDWLKSHPADGTKTSVSDESDLLLDTGGGLLKAIPLLEGGEDLVILHNADIATDFPIEEMQKFARESGADAVLLAQERETSRRLLFDNGARLSGWLNTSTGETRPVGLSADTLRPLAFGGVHIVRLSALRPLLEEYAAANGPVFSMTPFYLFAMHRLDIRAFLPTMPYRWHDIGTPEKLAAATASFSTAAL